MLTLKQLSIALIAAGMASAPAFAQETDTSSSSATTQTEVVTKHVKKTHLKKHHKKRQWHETRARHGRSVPYTQDVAQGSNLVDSPNVLLQQQPYLPFDLDVPGKAFVSTGPYVGLPIQYTGSNLVVNSPSVNTDLQLLGLRKSINEHLISTLGQTPIVKEEHPHLLLSGILESQASYVDRTPGSNASSSDIDVTNVSLDALILGPSPWLLGFMELSYDNGLPSSNSYRVSNSRIFVNKAFITIGNLQESPVYGTFGQFYVPFGTYSSVMVSDSLPKLITRTKARAVLLGFQQQDKNALYGSAYVFKGDSHTGSQSKINNGGLNLGYKFAGDTISGNVGGGVIANIADSAGLQGGAGFAAAERLAHRVPGYNLRGIVSLGSHLDVIAEYVTAAKSFAPEDMTFNNHGAKPWAFDTELAYTFTLAEKLPSTIAVGYAKTGDALALGLPLDRYSIVFSTSLWRNTLQSLEFRHDRNYSTRATASGPTIPDVACTSSICSGPGKADNAVTASFDYYF